MNSGYSSQSFFFQAEDGIRDVAVTGVQTCALPIFLVDQVDAARAGRLPGLRGDLGEDVRRGVVDDRLRGVEPEPVEVVLLDPQPDVGRSEERRVGKEWRSRRCSEQCKEQSGALRVA